MNSKRLTWLFLGVGATSGSYLPLLWGGSYFSFSSIFCSAVGALLGIWVSFKITSL